MDPQLEGYLNKILGSLGALAQTQEQQKQELSNLTQQVESMKVSITSQNERLEGMQCLAELSNVYRSSVEGGSERTDQSWTYESHVSSLPQTPDDLHVSLSQLSHSMQDILTEVRTLLSNQTDSMNLTLKDERYFLKDQLGNAQTKILERLGIFQQPSEGEDSEADVSAPTGISFSTLEEFRSTCKDLENAVRGVTRMELLWLEKEVKDKLSALETTVNGQIAGMNEKMMSLDKRLSEELDNKVHGLEHELVETIKKSVTETVDSYVSKENEQSKNLFDTIVENIKASSKTLSLTVTKTINEVHARVANQQRDDSVRKTEELKHLLTKTGDQLRENQVANIQKCTETVKVCQKVTEETGQRLSREIKVLKSHFGIFVLLIILSLCLHFSFSLKS